MKTHKKYWLRKFGEYSTTWSFCGKLIYVSGQTSRNWKDVDCVRCLKKGGRL